jgi:hypothetical protein
VSPNVEGVVESVNVGTPQPVWVNGHTVLTAIWKHPVSGRVPLRGVNLLGDDQADRTVHAGPDKAVYAYAREDIDWWEGELADSIGAAPFGENLTVRGVPVSEAIIGEQWTVGSALLQVAQPRLPCRSPARSSHARSWASVTSCPPRCTHPSCPPTCAPGCSSALPERLTARAIAEHTEKPCQQSSSLSSDSQRSPQPSGRSLTPETAQRQTRRSRGRSVGDQQAVDASAGHGADRTR